MPPVFLVDNQQISANILPILYMNDFKRNLTNWKIFTMATAKNFDTNGGGVWQGNCL
jgi:hypothetical protein